MGDPSHSIDDNGRIVDSRSPYFYCLGSIVDYDHFAQVDLGFDEFSTVDWVVGAAENWCLVHDAG